LIVASLVTLLGNAAYVFGLLSIDPTPVVLSASGALLVLGMAREGLFGVMPSALPEIAADHPDGLVVTGPDGSVRYVNSRARTLLAPIELPRGTRFLDVLRDPRLRPESEPILFRSAHASWTKLSRPAGVVLLLEADPVRSLLLAAKEVRGWRGRTKGHCVRISDLTEQREAERQVRQARRLDSVADLSRSVSRQFQGAFELVRNNANLLLADPLCDPVAERRLARVADAANYGLELAVELQLYTGTINTERIVLEVAAVVEECCELVERDLPPPVRLELAPSDRSLPVRVDAIQLRQCIVGVLTNAIEAMGRERGEIQVEVGLRRIDPAEMALVWGSDQPVGDYACVRVRDEGGGMSPEIEERIFEPFFSTRHKERGVGLAMVLGIARAHGAPLAFDNDFGRGCTVTVYFPLESEPEG
jgi:signal transduction histidine kinase